MQRTGTLAWELDIIKAHGLDRKADLQIETVELASTEAGKIALKGGSADMMLSDWLWVARERSLGDNLVFYPSSSTLGAVMVPAASPIAEIADLKGRKLAIAGGPLDKSWLLLQALARRAGVDLRRQATIVYGAPPLLSEKALQGETRGDADVLEFLRRSRKQGIPARHRDGRRHARARRQRAGRDRRLHVRRRLGGAQPRARSSGSSTPPGRRRRSSPRRRPNGSGWRRASACSDAAALAIYRQRYGEGIVRRPLAEEEADARALVSGAGRDRRRGTRRAGTRARAWHVLPPGGSGMNLALRLLSLALLIAAWYAGSQLAGARLLPDPQAVALAIVARSALGRARLQSRRDAGARRGGIRHRDGCSAR